MDHLLREYFNKGFSQLILLYCNSSTNFFCLTLIKDNNWRINNFLETADMLEHALEDRAT